MESTQSLQRKASQSTLSVQTEPKHEPASIATPLLESSDATLAPQGWPTSPSRIKHPLFPALLDGAFDIALFAFSSCFLVFSLVVMSYDGAPTSENPRATTALTRATKYGPTVFPLLFASVVGRATHAILIWRLEKGERIHILDTLATSTSLTSTVISQIQLRQISVLSVLLVLVWALSPIGGQASLRQMSIGAVKRSDASFQYVVPLKPLGMGLVGDLWVPTASTLLTSAMFATLSARTSSPVDLWGNVKIPKIEHYEKTANPDSGDWYNTTLSDDDFATYTSFVGIPIEGVKSGTIPTDYEFYLQTEYLQLTCASINRTASAEQPYGDTPSDLGEIQGDDDLFWYPSDDEVANRWYNALEALTPMNFSYVISTNQSGEPPEYATSVSCSVKNSYVEVGVLCAVGSPCQAVKVRRSRLPQLPPAFTIMDPMVGDFLAGLMWSIGYGEKGASFPITSILKQFLWYPALATPTDSRKLYLRQPISDEAWSDRFGHLLNSFWTCAYSTNTLSGGIHAASSYFWDTNITFSKPLQDESNPDSLSNHNWTTDGLKSKVWSSQGHKVEYIDIIKAHKPWAITLAITSLVLMAFGLIPLLVRHFLTNGPDIAMNFSSLATRNNPHVPIPAGGSFLPASDRFRLLKDLRLRFADAESKSDVGNLVIAAQGVEKAGYSRVRKGRLYE